MQNSAKMRLRSLTARKDNINTKDSDVGERQDAICVVSSDSEAESTDESDSELEELATQIGQQMTSKLASKQTSVGNKRKKTNATQDESMVNLENLGFVIDKTPGTSDRPIELEGTHPAGPSADRGSSDQESSEDSDDEEETKTRQQKRQNKGMQLSSSLQTGIDDSDIYVNVDSYTAPKMHNEKIESLLLKPSKGSEILKKSVIGPDFEKRLSIPPYEESLNQIRKQRRKERDITKGKNWFNMQAPEMTEDQKNDLTVLQMRGALNPKLFYKGPDRKALPKFFQMGRVMDNAVDYYNSRIPMKQRKTTLVDELLADAEFRQYNKRKYAEIMATKTKPRNAYKHMKRLKKKKK